MQLAFLCLILSALAAQPPQSVAPTPAPTPSSASAAGSATVDPEDLPVSLDRIQRALAKTPRLEFDESERPVFRVQVFGDKPTIDEILGPDWDKGPVPHGGMTHQEFLAMVTPKDVQGYAAFSNEEGMTVAASSFLVQWVLKKAIQEYRQTRDARRRDAARREVLAALDALEKARAAR